MTHLVNTRARARLTSLVGIAAACVVLGACAKQPRPKCTVARGNFAATYTLISGKGECAELKGEILGVNAYNAQASASDKTPDYDHASIGILPQSISDLLAAGATDSNAKHEPHALGEFDSSEPDSDGFCTAPKLSVSRLQSAEVPEQSDACMATPALPAVDIEYVWSDVRVYTTAAALGTQFSATLSYSKDGCTARYHVRAVYPSLSCAGTAPVPDGGQAEEDGGDSSSPMDAAIASASDEDAGGEADAACPPAPAPTPAPVADATLCSPDNGLNPDLDVRCDPDLLLCVLKREPPALR